MATYTINSNWFEGDYNTISNSDDKGYKYFGEVLTAHNCPMTCNDEMHEAIINSIYGNDEDIVLVNNGEGWDFSRN